ncbi:MAG: hypothetical protein R3F11_02310 [Verrucomicrobiales bacterium]
MTEAMPTGRGIRRRRGAGQAGRGWRIREGVAEGGSAVAAEDEIPRHSSE